MTEKAEQEQLGKTLPLGGFPIRSTNRHKLSAYLLAHIESRHSLAMFFANTNMIVKCRFLLEPQCNADILIINDGVGLDIAAKLMFGEKFEENLAGTDYMPFLFESAHRPLRIFMLGAKPEALAKAVRQVREGFGQVVVGSCDGFDGIKNTQAVLNQINTAQADIVLVAMGNPIQEVWITSHQKSINAPLLIGVGALFDFWSGNTPRAPKWLRRIRMEWLYRLSLEPRRLFRRYTVDILVFLRHCFKYR